MKRLLTLAATGLICGATVLATSGIAGAASTPRGPAAAQPGGPLVKAAGHAGLPTVSLNWSGYAATSKTPFSSVHSTFIQPSLKCTGAANQWTSNWVGLDGFNDQTVEQDGTFARCGGASHTTPVYKAWYEMYPAGSVNVFSVHPGDIIDDAVNYASGQFVLTISDLTTGKAATTSAKCSSCARASAEWIIERPALCNSSFTKCFLTELADFRSTTMSADWASVDGASAKNIGAFTNHPIFMIEPLKRGFISLDTVGALSGPSFTATWDRSGTTTPITLGPNR